MNDLNPHQIEAIELEEPEQINDLAELQVGDRVLINQDVEPKTIVSTDTRVLEAQHPDYDVSATVPVVEAEGDWSNAAPVELTHGVTLLSLNGQTFDYDVVDEDERIGAVVTTDPERDADVRRTHVAGSRSRAGNADRREVSA